MTRNQIEMAAQAIASVHGCDLSEGQCPALPGEPFNEFLNDKVEAAQKLLD